MTGRILGTTTSFLTCDLLLLLTWITIHNMDPNQLKFHLLSSLSMLYVLWNSNINVFEAYNVLCESDIWNWKLAGALLIKIQYLGTCHSISWYLYIRWKIVTIFIIIFQNYSSGFSRQISYGGLIKNSCYRYMFLVWICHIVLYLLTTVNLFWSVSLIDQTWVYVHIYFKWHVLTQISVYILATVLDYL